MMRKGVEALEEPDFDATIQLAPAALPRQIVPPPVSASAANPDSPVPFVFGRRIAQGGMGAILEASDCKLGRTIAVKIMLSEAACSEDQKQHFIQEAAVLGRLVGYGGDATRGQRGTVGRAAQLGGHFAWVLSM